MRPSSRSQRLAIAAMATVLALLSGSTIPLTTSAQSDTAPEQPSGLSTEVGDTQVRLSWDDPDDDSITDYQLWQIDQSATLTGTNGEFGYSVAVAGDIAVVGIPDDNDGSGDDPGEAFVFSRSADVWTLKYKLTSSGDVQDDGFGTSVAFDGEIIVVGAPFDVGKDGDGNDVTGAGAAYVFVEPASGWAGGTLAVDLTETAKLTASDGVGGDEGDQFGNSVAVDGDTVVVGADWDDSTKGAAYVFTKPSGGWGDDTETAKLTLSNRSNRAGGDYFGGSVAVDGDTIVVGAPGNQNTVDGTDVATGAAYIFTKPESGGWADATETATLTASDAAADDEFGYSVAVDGDTIVVGAHQPSYQVGGVTIKRPGAAYVFTKPSGGWASTSTAAKLTASDRADDDEFGYSVAVGGDTVVVGAYADHALDTDSGSAYIFTKPGDGWADGTETAKLTPSDGRQNHRFGSSVAVDGDTVVVGAENHETAYVFDIVDWEDIADSNAATKSHIVRRLTNDIEHTFRVRAVAGAEASDPSDYVSETPKASYAPARPLNFSATQTGEGEVELTWDAHRYPLSVTGYAYSQNDGGGPSWTDIDGSDSSTVSHTVTGLFEGVTYTFAVSAINSTGSTESDSRSVTIVGTPAAPDSFGAIAGDGQVWLGWRSPADFTISGYEYQQKEGTDAFGDWQTIPGSRAGSTFHIVTGLTNDMSYTFRVRTVNAAGESDASGEQSATPVTASSAPVKPEGFAARQTGIGQVELTWGASSNPLNVTGYQFRQNNGSWTTISESDHSTVSHTITGLTQGVAYTFRVRAVNSAGNGVSSDSQSVDVPAAPNPFAAEAGDTQVRLTWGDPDNASITKYQLWQFPPTSIKLISSDRFDNDELGWSVAVDGDTLVIGATGDDPDNTGAAYVFTRDASGWVQVGKLTAAVRRDDAGFGYAVAVHGDTIVVGAYEDDFEGGNAGAAYVFTRPANGWADMTQTARLTAGSDAAGGDEFGTSVAVHGDTIVVGAPEKDTVLGDNYDNARGSAYIFTKPANGWADMTETAALRGQSDGDRFGRSVAVHGDTVVVGAHEEKETDKKGAAYVFTKSAATGVWDDWNGKNGSNATARLTASDRANGDRFGRAVAMDGDTIVIGALYHDYDDPDVDANDVSDSGAAYVFIKPATGGWDTDTETAKLTASDRAENDQFGYSVAVDGDTIVVGADQDDSKRGTVYVFTKPDGGWANDTDSDDDGEFDHTTETATLAAYDRSQNDRFGNSVAVDGDTVLVGAAGDDSDKGSAYVFGTEWSDIPGSGAGTTSHIATRLPNGAEHTFRVRAVNAAGAGDASDAVMKTPTKAGSAPDAPADFTATQVGIGKVLLEWAASRDPLTGLNPLTVSRYRFELGKNGSGTWADIHGSDSSTASHTVTSLTTGDTYTFDLRAVNGGGSGPAAGFAPVTIVDRPEIPSGFGAVAGDEQVKLSWGDPGADSPPIDKHQLLQIDPSKLTAGDGLGGDLFGYSVVVDGNTAVIGAHQDDTRNGSAYVFTKVSGVWSQAAKLTASDGAADDEFGYSVAVDGDTIVVGAHQNDADTNDEGAAYVFTKPALGWGDWSNLDTNGKAGLTTKLTAFGAAAGDEFGISVAVDGDTILVGAHLEDANDDDTDPNNNVTDSGAAYIFTKFSGVWGNAPVSGNHRVETAKLVAAGAAADDEFGISVAVDGDTAVIGARKDDDNGNQSGSAYVFTKVSGVWSQKAKLIASDGAADDEFGSSVAVDGDTVVVGAHKADYIDLNNSSNNLADSGAAYVFTKPEGGGWADATETAKLTASDGAANDEFGISVAVDGDTIVVGAHQNDADTNNNDEGAAYLFTEPARGWADMTQKAKLTASDAAAGDRYGYSVGVSGDTIAVGAPYNDYDDTDGDTDDDEGAAYFLSVLEWADIPDSGVATTSHIVTGLTNDEEHTFQVRGANAAGVGFASASAGGTPTFAIPNRPTGFAADAGDAVVDLTWVDPEDSTIEKYQMLQITQGGKLTAASTGDPVVRGDGFGISVAADGDTAVVGAYQDDDATNDNSGSAHVFTRSSSAAPWSWSAKLTASDAAANDEFGIAVAVDGDTIVVGAHQNDADDQDNNEGAAYVFTWNSSNSKWEQKAKLTASDAAANDEFGIAVAVDGDTIVVGAHQNDSNKGAAYVFTKPESGGWADATETAKLTASDAAANDEFGISVAVHGETVVVGAHQNDSNKGAAYVFTKPGSGGWVNATETAKLAASDGAADDELGISVAVDGDTVVLGAHKYDVDDNGTSIPNAGAAYVFTKPETDANADESKDWKDWASLDDKGKAGLTAKLIASDAARGDEFGISVAVDDDDDTIVVGAYLDDDNGDNSGSAYVFTRDSNGWSQKTKLTGPSRGKGYWLGHSVAVVGNTVIAGADKSNISGPDSGAVYLWTVPSWTDIANSGATTTSHTVTGLTNRVEYSLQVRAVDVDKVEGVGAGPPSEVRATPLKPRPAKPTGLSAAPGDTQVKLSWNDPVEGSPPITSYQLWQHAENAVLTATNRADNDEFGYAVAIDGNTAVVGMPGEDSPDDSGAAFVFTRDQVTGTWSQVARLRASDPGTQDTDEYRFGLSVAVHEDTSNGDTIVVGAPDHSGNKGAVYVFTEPSGGWANDEDEDGNGEDDHTTETAKFLASDGTANDEFGNSVAVDGNTIVVGAHNNNAAYIFTKPATGWANDSGEDHTTETLKLSRSGSSDDFGKSVAIDGDNIVVGASGVDSGTGSAFVFIEPDTGWANSPGTEVAELTAYDRSGGDRFGRSVAIDCKTIVVGAYGDDSNKGSAYVFSEPDTGWANSPGTEMAKLTASDGDGGDQFGFSVAVDGDTVLIGADALNETNRSGSAYAFTKPESGGWADTTEAAKLTGSGTANGDRFGLSVALDRVAVSEGVYRLTAMVGANGQGDNDEGAAYLYDIRVWAPITGSTGGTRSHFETGLTNGLDHTFAVRAVNDGGASGPSNQASAQPVAEATPPAKPRNFSAVQVAKGAVRLEWEPNADPLTIVTFKYTADGGSNWPKAVGSHSTTVSYTVSDLTVGTTYTFAVRAVNSAGDGDSSDLREVTIVAAPAAPTGLRADPGDEQVELSWSYSGGQTSITGFQYQQKTGDDFDDDWTDVTGSTWGTRSHIVTGLTNGIEHAFRVRAVNVTVRSEPSNTVTSAPSAADSRPARPTDFNAEQTGVGQVELTWDTAPARLSVTGYQYTDNGGSDWNNISGSDSGTVYHTVTGLTTETTYTFAVRAVNSGTLPGLSSVSRDVTIVGEPGAPTGVSATGGDTQATVRWSVPSDENDPPLIDKYQLLQISISTLTAGADGETNDEFGYSVAIDGNTAVVGAYHRNLDGNTNVGVAYVFTKDSDDAWSQAATLTASDGAANDEFGISVAIDGNTIVVGTRQDDTRNGAAYVFTKADDVAWANDSGENHKEEAAKLIASDGAANDEFGISVAIDGDTVVAGAHLHDINDNGTDIPNAGAAYVFTKADDVAWANASGENHKEEAAKLIASDGAANDELGISVAIDGNTIVVGARQDDTRNGAAYVFTKADDVAWANDSGENHKEEGAKFTAPDGAADDEFGISVAINVDIVVVGAHKADYIDLNDSSNNLADSGAAYVFTRDSNSGKWGQPVKLTASNGHADDGFGNSVAVDGNTAVVGAYLDDRDNAARDTGSTYVFARKFGVWSETLNLAGPDPGQSPRLGYSVAVSNDTVLAGVPQDDGSRGSAYAMDISTAKWVDFVSKELTMSDDDEYYVYRMLNLTNDQQYAFRVRSVNAAANRPSAETVAATPRSAKPGRIEGLSAQPGDSRVTLSWDDPRDSSLTGYQVLQPTEQTKLTARSDGAKNDQFGHSVSVDGNVAVIGAYQHDTNGNDNAGAAYVFTKVSGAWSGPVKLIASDGAAKDEFGISVAIDVDTVVVGAHQPTYQENNKDVDVGPGAAYVFTEVDGVWSQAAKLTASDGVVNDWFGYSVAVYEDTIVIGARQHDVDGNSNAGAAYLFTKPTGGSWADSTEAKLTASGGAGFDYFGQSVAVHGNTIVVGAHQHDVTEEQDNTGAAYVFTKSGAWANNSAQVELTATDADTGAQFGYSVAVDGDTVVVGAEKDDNTRGSAYVFTKPTDHDWADNTETARLAASDRGLSDAFGSSVAVRDGTIVVGAYANNIDVCDSDKFNCDEDPRSGAAYLFTKPDGAVWTNDPNKDYRTESGKLTLPTEEGSPEEDDQYGNSVALDGQSIVVGAPQDDVETDVDDFGSVYVSDIPQWGFLASGAETTSATVGGLTNGVEYAFQVRAVDFYGGGPPSDIVRATPMPAPNRAPYYIGNDSVTFTVDENTPPGSPVGDAVAATDPDGDVLTYSLSGIDASSFVLDGSTGQITVGSGTLLDYESGPTRYTVVVSVHDGRGAYDDDSAVDDLIEVIIDVNNVDEAGTVSLSPEQPEVGTPVAASLRDPDGSVSDISWQWARSSDGSDWSDISGANSDSYTLVADDAGVHLQATASYTDGHGPGKSAHAVMERQTAQPAAPNRAPYFIGSDTVTFTVDENTPPGSPVGDAVAATDPDGDVLTYSLSGTDASSFVIDGSTSQITVGSGTLLDYESGPTRYTVVVSVHDGRGAYDDDSAVDDRIEVIIDVNNVDEAGTVSLSPEQPEVGTPVAASLRDPDGSLSDISWQWARSSDRTDWSDISGANSDSYTPVAGDVGVHLQATASYTDGHGPGKSAHAVMERQTAQRGRQTAQRGPSFEGDVTLTVDENAPPGSLVGDAVAATDPDGDVLTYSLSGTDAASFVLDGSTGQITAKTLLDYETQSQYSVRVRVRDGQGGIDSIEVIIDVNNVDEAGTVSVSPEQPEVGTPVAASLRDPDGSVSDISWQWARSSDRTDWSDISGANSDSYTPVADDVGVHLQATASYTDGHGPGKSAHAVMERQTAQRGPSFEGDVTLTVDENAPPGSPVGDAVAATDPDGDVLTYSLSGTDASSFVLDGSTGQITVGSGTLLDYESGPARYTVVVSVHDGRGAYGDDDTAVDDLIEVSIDVSNVDEAGTVSVSPEQPEVGTPVAASLRDPDGSLSDISWQWARSSDGSNWSDISGADSDSYTTVADDVGVHLQATASYTDGHGPGKSAHAVMERQTAQRGPSFEGDVTLTVDENTPPGSPVGDAVAATDPDGDVLTYLLSGTDASSFVLDGSTGQITVGSGTLLDYESGPTRYTVVVSVHDGRGAYGGDDTAVDASIEVSIDVSNVDEAGTVSVSLEQPEVGTALVASLRDPDGSLSDISWQWARSSDRTDWQDMAGASSFTYTPVDLDADNHLRVTASYADGEGSGKQAQAVLNNPVQGLPEPVATPTTTPTDTPAPEPTSTPTPTLTAPTPTPTAEPAPSEADGGDEGFPWWVIVAVVIGVVAGVVLTIVALRRRR